MNDVALATVVSTLVASMVGYLTQRSASKGTETVAETTTRGDMEKEAFVRIEAFYKGVVERQDEEIKAQAEEIKGLKSRVEALEDRESALEIERDYYRKTGRRMARALFDIRNDVAKGKLPPPLDESIVEDAINFMDQND